MTAHHHASQAHAPAHAEPDPDLSPTEYWEQRYSGSERVWSGKVNATMASVVAELAPGTAIDLGCGEGGDVLWLAEQGWTALGLDISATAVGRARDEAAARGLDGASFEAVDLDAWEPEPAWVDLVTASFFQSNVALDRTAILRRAAAAIRSGGHLVIVSHAAPPSWATDHPARMVGAEEDVAQLALPDDEWEVRIAENRPRAATAPDGSAGEHLDAVVLLRRR
ncbi:class I SAM-dependent methyltransferase [Brachybacterium paraconglomeratum]|uniref:class I SAM-dependent methyltransferase n=1 Tax=Brachybacterium paraconglomeratum TaxID=173362 RepID=UPI0035147264